MIEAPVRNCYITMVTHVLACIFTGLEGPLMNLLKQQKTLRSISSAKLVHLQHVAATLLCTWCPAVANYDVYKVITPVNTMKEGPTTGEERHLVESICMLHACNASAASTYCLCVLTMMLLIFAERRASCGLLDIY